MHDAAAEPCRAGSLGTDVSGVDERDHNQHRAEDDCTASTRRARREVAGGGCRGRGDHRGRDDDEQDVLGDREVQREHHDDRREPRVTGHS